MMCFRDMTFCTFYNECVDGDSCKRALTDDIKNAAKVWWGSEDAPIAQFVNKLGCFKAKE